MYELVRYFHASPETKPSTRGQTPLRGLRREVLDDDVAEHLPVALAQRRVEQVAVEDRAEGVAVRDAEDAERADHHVQVDRVDLAREAAVGSPALEDALDQLDHRRVLARELGAGDVLRAVDVLDADQPDE